MRKAYDFQTSLTHEWLPLDHAKELQALSGLIDEHPKIAELVLQDLTREARHRTRASGASADLVFRALMLKQMHTWSYEELHFHSTTPRLSGHFARSPWVSKFPPGRRSLRRSKKSDRRLLKPSTGF